MSEEQRVADALGQVLETAKAQRQSWDTLVRGIKEYEDLCAKLQDIDLGKREFWNVRVNIPEQFRREIGARLINSNPKIRSSVKEWAARFNPTSVAQAEIIEYILNHSVGESDFYDEMQLTRDSGLTTGRGVQMVGIDRKRGTPIGVQFDPMDLWLDPDAETWREANIAFRRRMRPRWWWMKKFPAMADSIVSAIAVDRPTDVMAKQRSRNSALEMVEGYECWSKIGMHRYKDGMLFDTKAQDIPRKYWLLGSSGAYTLLGETSWETPFHRDSGRASWPFECFDCYMTQNSLYPDPPLRPAWPWIQAFNFMVALFVWRMRRSMDLNIAVIAQDGVKITEDSLVQMLKGSDGEVMRVLTLTSGLNPEETPDIRKYIQYMDENFDIGKFLESLAYIRRMISEESGLHEFLYAGDPPKQDRSAKATSVRESFASNRILQYQTNFDQFMNRLLRKEALCARYHLKGEDIAPYAGPEMAQAWDQFNLEDYSTLFQETNYDIELGSTRRKTPEQAADAADVLINHALGPLQQAGANQTVAIIIESYLRDAMQVDEFKTQQVSQEFTMLTQRANLRGEVQGLEQQAASLQQQVSAMQQQVGQPPAGGPPMGMPPM